MKNGLGPYLLFDTCSNLSLFKLNLLLFQSSSESFFP